MTASAKSRQTCAVVTDSTACLSAELLDQLGVSVVPLRVTLGSRTAVDGVNVSSSDVARALRAKVAVSTSRPTPAEFAVFFRAEKERWARIIRETGAKVD